MADRSLTVRLKAEFEQYRRESEAATRGTERLGEAGQEAGREIDRALGRAEDAAEDLRRSLADVGRIQALKLVAADANLAEGALDDAADEAERLDRAIDQVSMEIARLNREILRTGDMSLFGRIDEQRSTLQTLRRMRAELGEAKKDVEVIAKSTRDGFREALSALPSEIKGALILGLVGAAVLMAPLIGGALAGAVVGTVGAGGILGGLVSAARDTRVRQAAMRLVDSLRGPFDRLGAEFVQPVVSSLTILSDTAVAMFRRLLPEISALRPVVVELARGLAGFFVEAEPGFVAALRAAQPILRSIAQELPELGRAFGDMLRVLSEDTDGAIMALRALFDLIEYSLRSIGTGLRLLGEMFQFLASVQESFGSIGDRVFGWVPGLGSMFRFARDRAIELKGSVEEAGQVGEGVNERLESGYRDLRTEIDRTTEAILAQHQALREQADPVLRLMNSFARLDEAQQRYNEAVDEHGRESEEARAAMRDLLAATIDVDGAVREAATSGFDGKLTPAMRKAAEAAGWSKQDIDALERELKQLIDRGRQYDGSVWDATVRLHWRIDPPPQIPRFGMQVPFQHGGPVIGPAGVDQVPARLTAGEHVWTVDEVRAAGGHQAVAAMRAAVLASQSRTSIPATVGSPARDTSVGTTHTITYQIYPQRADFTIADLDALVRTQDALVRVGRPR